MIMVSEVDDLDLFASDQSAKCRTPIARELQIHFDSGGSVEDAIRLVAALERAFQFKRLESREARKVPARGSRLDPEWHPSEGELQFALTRGLTKERILSEAEKFTNYWTAKTGASATKRDWSATWRNWILNVLERQNGFERTFGRPAVASDAILAGMGRLAARLDQNGRAAIRERREVSSEPSDPTPRLALESPRTLSAREGRNQSSGILRDDCGET